MANRLAYIPMILSKVNWLEACVIIFDKILIVRYVLA